MLLSYLQNKAGEIGYKLLQTNFQRISIAKLVLLRKILPSKSNSILLRARDFTASRARRIALVSFYHRSSFNHQRRRARFFLEPGDELKGIIDVPGPPHRMPRRMWIFMMLELIRDIIFRRFGSSSGKLVLLNVRGGGGGQVIVIFGGFPFARGSESMPWSSTMTWQGDTQGSGSNAHVIPPRLPVVKGLTHVH